MAHSDRDYEPFTLKELVVAAKNPSAIPLPTVGQPTNGIGARVVTVNGQRITFAGTQHIDSSAS